MKKALVVVASLILLFIGALVAAPYFFKDRIIALVKEKANENLKAKINFSDADISLFSDFPHMHVRLDNFSIVNNPPRPDTLAKIASLGASIGVLSYITDDRVDILAVDVERPVINARIYADSTKNWDIFIEKPEDKGKPESTIPDGLNVELREYSVTDGTILFNDEAGNMSFTMRKFNHRGSGDFAKKVFTLETESDGTMWFKKGGIPFLANTDAKMRADLAFDLNNNRITLKENELLLNTLPIGFDGVVGLLDSAYDINVNFRAKESEFKHFLSLIPALFKNKVKNFDKLKSSGTMAFGGNVKGIFSENSLPGFTMVLRVNNGFFQYPDLPQAVRNVNVDMNLANPNGVPDRTIVNIKQAHAEIAGDPFDARIFLRTPVSDPYIDGHFRGRINLDNVKKVVPLEEGTSVGGIVGGDITLKGNLSTLKSGQYERFSALGSGYAQNILLTSKELPERVQVHSANLQFSPQFAALSNLAVKIGESDIRGSGRLDNLIGYALSDELLKGTMNISSNYFNLNPWLGVTNKVTNANGNVQTQRKATQLPKNIDMNFSANMAKVIYDSITVTNVQAALNVRDQIVTLINTQMNIFGGSMTMKGSYDTRNPDKPHSDFQLSVKRIGFAEAYNSFSTAKAFAPFLRYMQGNFDADINLNSDLNEQLFPILPSVTSIGGLMIDKMRIEGFKPFNEIANTLKLDWLRNPTLISLSPKYRIENGRLILPEFNFRAGDQTVKMRGSSGLDKSIDYIMTVTVPTGNISSAANAAISSLLKTKVAAIKSNAVNVDVLIRGTIDNPKISTTLAGAAQQEADNAVTDLKDEAQRRIDEEKAKLEQRAKEEQERLRKQAEEERAKLEQKARDEADRARQRAEEEKERLRKQAEEEKERLRKKAEEELKKKIPFPR